MSAKGDRSVGYIWRCPRCGCEHKRRFVPVDFLDDSRRVVDRLVDWIEKNVEGAQVYRDTGMVAV